MKKKIENKYKEICEKCEKKNDCMVWDCWKRWEKDEKEIVKILPLDWGNVLPRYYNNKNTCFLELEHSLIEWCK